MTSPLIPRIFQSLRALHDLEIDSKAIEESLLAVKQTLVNWQEHTRIRPQKVLTEVIEPLDAALEEALEHMGWIAATAQINTSLLRSVEPLIVHSRAAETAATNAQGVTPTAVECDAAGLLFAVDMFVDSSKNTLNRADFLMNRLGETLVDLVGGHRSLSRSTLH